MLATAPGQLNPYKLGIELFRDIEDRWNKGRFGNEWDECENLDERARVGQAAGPGPQEDLRGAPLYNDVTFIDEFLTAEFCERNKFFSFALNDRTRQLRDRVARVPARSSRSCCSS